MIIEILMTLLCLITILISCFNFSNAVEWLGKKLNLSQGVVGSVLAAVGTALPETIIPFIAIIFYKGADGADIGVGAIAGAPFMLATLAFFVTGLAVIIFTLFGKRTIRMNVDMSIFSRDLTFFIIIYSLAILSTLFYQIIILKYIVALVLCLAYIVFLKQTFNDVCIDCENLDKLYFSRIFKVDNSLFWIYVQITISLIGIIIGAHFFIKYVEFLSIAWGVAPLILSIIITPFATELPEKLNSVIWVGQKKDTLALGNITGAMVFQSCFPVIVGMLLTTWDLQGITILSAVIALSAALINLIWIKVFKTVNAYVLLFGGVLYGIFIYVVFFVK